MHHKENYLHLDLLMEDYLRSQGIGSSSLAYILPPYSPLDYVTNLVRPYFTGNSGSNLGTIIHSALLEPKTFGSLYAVEPEKIDKRTKAGKEQAKAFADDAKGKTVISYQDNEVLQSILNYAYAHSQLKEILSDGAAEVTGFARVAKHLTDSGEGILCKSREDWLCDDGYIYDIKTTSMMPTDDNIQKIILKYNYHFKAVHHLEVMRRCGVNAKGFAWIFISTHLPVKHIVIRKMGSAMHSFAYNMWREAIDTVAQCENTQIWPSYSESVQEIELPDWAIKRND